MNWTLGVPPIATPRLTIRPMNVTDASQVFSYRSLPEVQQFQLHHPKCIDDVSAFIESASRLPVGTGDWLQLAICESISSRVIGDIGLHNLESPDGSTEAVGAVEVGCTLAPSYQGVGYAVESLRHVIEWLLLSGGVHKVTAYVDTENAKSISLMHRLNMHREGCLRRSIRVRNEWRDEYIYGLLLEDLPSISQ